MKSQPEKPIQTAVYEAPQVIYDGEIGTRAGSPAGRPSDSPIADPSDLFE